MKLNLTIGNFYQKMLCALFVCLGVLAQVMLLIPARADAVADPHEHSAASSYLNNLNATRSAHGLSSLALSGTLSSGAQAHAEQMGATTSLDHTPNIGALCSVAGTWDDCAENIGAITLFENSVEMIAATFMNSSLHRGHILNGNFDTVGIGVEEAAGKMWISVTFMDASNVAPAPTAPPRPAQQSAPKPEAQPTPTTVPAPVQPPAVVENPLLADGLMFKGSRAKSHNWYEQLPMITHKDFLGE